MKNRSTVTNLLEYSSFVLNSIEEGWQVDSVYTDFPKAFDRVLHQLLLEEMSMVIERARCLWLRSYLTGRIQRIRIGGAVSKDIMVTSGVPPESLRSLYTSLVHPKLEYASCVWSPFYDVRVEKVERVQRRFIRYALRSFGWTYIYDLPPYEQRCALLRLDTLVKRRSIACIMLVFDVLGGRMNSSSLLSALDLKTPRYRTRGSEFLRIGFHCTNYGAHEPMSAAMHEFNEVIGLFDFILTRNQFVNRLRLTL
jgi:hypothetical protein